MDVVSGKIRQLTTDVRPDSNPSWSHNGQYIAFLRRSNPVYGTTFLWTVPAMGEKPIKLSAKLDRNVRSKPLWSGDDKHIYFTLEDSGNLHLCRILFSGGEIERVIAGERTLSNPVISPDGQYIAFTIGEILSPQSSILPKPMVRN